MNALRFTALGGEDLLIKALRLTASGSGNDFGDIGAVELFLDVDRNGLYDPAIDQRLGKPQRFSEDDGVIVFRDFAVLIPSDQSRDLLVTLNLNGVPLPGATFRISVWESSDVTAVTRGSEPISAAGEFPLHGREALVVAPGTTAGVLQVQRGSAVYAPGKAAPGETFVVMAQIQLHATSVEHVLIRGLRVRLSGTAVSAVRIAVDADENGIYDPAIDDVLDARVPPFDDDTAVFDFSPRLLQAGGNQKWLVMHDVSVAAEPGTTLKVTIVKEDVFARGAESSLPIVPDGCDVPGPERTVDTAGARLTIWNHPLPLPGLALPYGQNLDVLGFDVHVGGAEGVYLRELRVRGWGPCDEPKDIRRAVLWRGNLIVAVVEFPFLGDDGEAVFALNEWLPAGTREAWKVALDLAGWSASGKDIQLFFDLRTGPSPIAMETVGGDPVTPAGGLVIGWWTPVQPLDGSEGEESGGCLGSLPARSGARWVWFLPFLLIFFRRRGGAR